MKKKYTEEELCEMHKMRKQGATYKQIADKFGRSVVAVQQKFVEKGWTKWGDENPKIIERKAKLSDFKPREMIKYLYELGYRIKNNRLVLITESVIDINKILVD